MNNRIGEQTAQPARELSTESAVARITEGLDLLVEEMHPLSSVAQFFRALLVERARFKAQLPDFAAVPIETVARSRFERGVPLSSIGDLLDEIDAPLWAASAERLMPVMKKSFPKIGPELEIIEGELLKNRLNPRAILEASLTGREDANARVASRIAINPHSLAFALGQIAKPLIEKLCDHLSPLIENLSWSKGYCPICGTMPELAFLRGEGGQRWLRCASCAYEWRFKRLLCPFCESDSQRDFEIYFVEGREFESVDVCHKCNRYVSTIDLRNRPRPIAREVAALALMHLDVIAQEKGFLPAAVCAWNIVRDRDVFSVPVKL